MPPKKKKKTGPPPKPEAEKARLRSTTLPPAVDDWLQQIGAGSVSRGMRAVLVREYERTTAAKPVWESAMHAPGYVVVDLRPLEG